MATIQIPASLANLGHNLLPESIAAQIRAAGGTISEPEQGDGASGYFTPTISFPGMSEAEMTEWLINQPQFVQGTGLTAADLRAADAGQPTAAYTQAQQTATTRGNKDNSKFIDRVMQNFAKFGWVGGVGSALLGGASAAGTLGTDAASYLPSGELANTAANTFTTNASQAAASQAAGTLGTDAATYTASGQMANSITPELAREMAANAIKSGVAKDAVIDSLVKNWGLTETAAAATVTAAAATSADTFTRDINSVRSIATQGGDYADLYNGVPRIPGVGDGPGQSWATKLIEAGIPSSVAQAVDAAIRAGGDVNAILKQFNLDGNSAVTNLFRGLLTGAAQTLPYKNLDSAGQYMTNAGWSKLDPNSVANQAMTTTGFKIGGVDTLAQQQANAGYKTLDAAQVAKDAQANAGYKVGGYVDPQYLLNAQNQTGFKQGGYVDPSYLKAQQDAVGFVKYDQQDLANKSMAQAGYKSGGIGSMPTDLYSTYSDFIKNPMGLTATPGYQAWDKLAGDADQAKLLAKGLGSSGNALDQLSQNRQARTFGYLPQYGSMLQGGAQTEADRWNTANTANMNAGKFGESLYNTAMTQNTALGNLAGANYGRLNDANTQAGNLALSNYQGVNTANINAGNLANNQFNSVMNQNYNAGTLANNNFQTTNAANIAAGTLSNTLFNSAMNQNNAAAVTGINQMGSDVSMADRMAGGATKAVNTAFGTPTTNLQQYIPGTTWKVDASGNLVRT